MSNENKIEPSKYSNFKIIKLLFRGLAIIFIGVALCLFIISLPWVQKRIINYFTTYITESTKYKTSIGSVNLGWFDEFHFQNVEILGKDNTTLIGIGKLEVDINITKFWTKNRLLFDEVNINRPSVHLKFEEDDLINIKKFAFAVGDALKGNNIDNEKKEDTSTPFKFEIPVIHIDKGIFTYYDFDEAEFPKKFFDYYHLDFKEINAEVTDFSIMDGVLRLTVDHLDLKTPQPHLYVKHLATKYTYAPRQMKFENLLLETGKSTVKNYLQFDYQDVLDMVDFNQKTWVTLNIQNSNIHTDDLGYFFSYFKKKKQNLLVTGNAEGKVVDFIVNFMDIKTKNNTNIAIKGGFKGLPDFENTFIEGEIKKSIIQPTEIVDFLENTSFDELLQFEKLELEGEYKGLKRDFETNAKVKSDLGDFDISLDFNYDEKLNKIQLEGDFQTRKMPLGYWSKNQNTFDNISFKTSFKGHIGDSIFSIKKSSFNFLNHIDTLELFGEKITNIDTKISNSGKSIKGDIYVNDVRLKLKSKFIFENSEIMKLNIYAPFIEGELSLWNFHTKGHYLKTELIGRFKGSDINNLEGNVTLSSTFLKKENKLVPIEHFEIDTQIKDDVRYLNVNSSALKLKSEGKYKIEAFISHIFENILEYKMAFINETEKIDDYYLNKKSIIEPMHISMEVLPKNINPILDFFKIPIQINSRTPLNGNIQVTGTTLANLYGKIDSLKVKEVLFVNTDLDISTSKFKDKNEILSSIDVFSKKQHYDNIIQESDSLLINAWWNNNIIVFDTSLAHPKTDSKISLKIDTEYLKDSTKIRLFHEEMKLFSKIWKPNKNQNIVILDNSTIIEHIEFSNQNEFVNIGGIYNDNPNEYISFTMENISLNTFSTIFSKKIEGTIQGELQIKKLNFLHNLDGDLYINNFEINNFLIGNINTNIHPISLYKHYLNFSVNKNGNDYLFGIGNYDSKFDPIYIDFNLIFNHLPIKIFEEYFPEFLENMSGEINGFAVVKGPINNLQMDGNGKIQAGKTFLTYLQTPFTFDGNFYVNNQMIGVDSLVLTDPLQQQGVLKGGIIHNQLSDFQLDVKGYFEQLQLLNLKPKDSEYYYGKGIGTGNISISGPLSHINITTNIKTDEGTKIFIPYETEEFIVDNEFIHFISEKDSTNALINHHNLNELPKEIKSNLPTLPGDDSDVKIDFILNLEVTKDANTKIIFDEKTDDMLEGTAKGVLQLRLDEYDNFTVKGEISIIEAEYRFILKNILSKKFEFVPNSSIKWNGDPYKGILDMSAKYTQLASLSPFYEESTIVQNPDIDRKYPATVLLNMTGEMLQPTLDFDINFDAYPYTLSNEVVEVKSRILADEKETQRQVFSLIVLYKFSPYDNFALTLSQQLGGSISEILSNQLSSWVSKVDENLEIDIDLGKLDKDTFDDLQLRLSYTLMKGRMKVTRDGGLTDGRSHTNANSIAGNWKLEYLLYPDSRLKLKIYKKNNYDALTTQLDNTISTGVSLVFSKDFHELREIWKNQRKLYLESLEKNNLDDK